MSIEVPLQYNEEIPIAGLSSEYALVSSQMADRGLIYAPVNDRNKLGRVPRTKKINLSGIDMMPEAYDGLVQRGDYMTFTDAQAYQELENAVSRKPTNAVMDADGYTLGSQNTDPRLLGILMRESKVSDDNVFNQSTQNFIRAVQQSNQNLYEEANLYYLPPATTGTAITSASVDTLAPGIIAQGQEMETKRREGEEAAQGEKVLKPEPEKLTPKESALVAGFKAASDKKGYLTQGKVEDISKALAKNKVAIQALAQVAKAAGVPEGIIRAATTTAGIARVIETIRARAEQLVGAERLREAIGAAF